MRNIILATMILTSCGEINTPQDSKQAEPVNTEKPADVATVSSDQIGASFYIDAKSDLWACTDKLEKQLVYIDTEDSFYYCKKSEWTAVQINNVQQTKEAATVVTATTGKDGTSGKDGANGKDGTNGKDGANGKDAPVVGADEWIDPVTNSKWFLGKSFVAAQVLQVKTICPQGSNSPSEAELSDAGLSGLYERYSSQDKAWVGIDATSLGAKFVSLYPDYRFQGTLGNRNIGSTETFRALCLKK